jgi:hypothetical protein
MNHGSGATLYVSAKRPTPVFSRVIAYPPMRACTLATLEVVTTLPETVSPGWTVVSLTATARICGAASGGRRGTLTASLGGVTTGDGDTGVREADGGRGTPAVRAATGPAFPAALPERPAGGGVFDVGCPPLGAAAWLQPASQSEAAPMARAERTLGMRPSSWSPRTFRSG